VRAGRAGRRPKYAPLARTRRAVAAGLVSILLPTFLFAQESALLKTHFSGYVKSLSFFTRTSGLAPEVAFSPAARLEEHEDVFNTLGRLRLKLQSRAQLAENHRVTVNVHYDNQSSFGSFIETGDFRMSRRISERRQFLDLSQTLVDKEDAYYEHRLYRASILYESPWFDAEIGRQQIPWGVGHFFTPTDLFNPFDPTQIELDERDGVDALNFRSKRWQGYLFQFVYTPNGANGRDLHPDRYLARLSKDVGGYEVGLLGGRIRRDHAAGFDFQGNVGDSAVRGEFLYREAQLEKDFMKFTVNADYNFPHNVYALLEYHYNGQGRRSSGAYQLDRFIEGDIQQLARNYLGLSLGYDITPLLRLENRTIFNMDDVSFFVRPELQYELRSNFLITVASQLFLGANVDEFGRPANLFLGEMLYTF
jgi:hypothetical protein